MRKVEYVTPVMHVQEFVANEYVASCGWCVPCEYGEAGGESGIKNETYEAGKTGIWHSKRTSDGTGCGWASHQVISLNEDGTVSMVEIKVQNQSDLVCTLTNEKYEPMTYTGFTVGQTIYWTTQSANGSQKWYHKGTVSATESNHS